MKSWKELSLKQKILRGILIYLVVMFIFGTVIPLLNRDKEAEATKLAADQVKRQEFVNATNKQVSLLLGSTGMKYAMHSSNRDCGIEVHMSLKQAQAMKADRLVATDFVGNLQRNLAANPGAKCWIVGIYNGQEIFTAFFPHSGGPPDLEYTER